MAVHRILSQKTGDLLLGHFAGVPDGGSAAVRAHRNAVHNCHSQCHFKVV